MKKENYILNEEIGEIRFTPSHIERFHELGIQMEVPKNYTLFHVGDVADCCYYIEDGAVVSFEYTASGGEHVFSSNRSGTMILIPSMLVTHVLTLNFKTSVASKLIKIKKEVLFSVIAEEPDMAADLLCALSHRLIGTIEQFRERGNYSVPWRVCKFFLFVAGQSGVEYDGKIMIQSKISQQEMANRLQANRVTVARAIRELKDLGLVEYINGYYCIRDSEKMKRHMEYIENIS